MKNRAVGVLCEKSPDRPSMATTGEGVAGSIIPVSDIASQRHFSPPLLFPIDWAAIRCPASPAGSDAPCNRSE